MKKIETQHGIFESNELTGQTAQEVYQEWLENKDKPLKTQEDYLLELEFRLSIIELGL